MGVTRFTRTTQSIPIVRCVHVDEKQLCRVGYLSGKDKSSKAPSEAEASRFTAVLPKTINLFWDN